MNDDLAPTLPPQMQSPELLTKNNNEGEINLLELWYTVYRHKWQIIGLAITAGLLAIIIVSSLKSIYKATTIIILETQQIKTVSIEEIYGLDSANKEYFNSQIGIMQSRKLAQRVVDKLNLTTNRYFDPRQQKPARFSLKSILPESFQQQKVTMNETQIMQSVVGKVVKNLSIIQKRGSQLIEISFESNSPKLAAEITVEVAESYISLGFEANLEVTQKAVGWLTERLSGLKETLDNSENKLFSYRNKAGLLDVKGVHTVSEKELADISDKLMDTKRDRLTIEATYRQIKSINNPTVRDYESIPGLLDSASVGRTKGLVDIAEEKLTELSKVYGKKHPKMISAQANYNKVYAKYFRLLSNAAKRVERKFNAIKSNETTLRRELNRTKGDIRNINKKSFKLKALQAEVESNRRLYETFFSRFKETNETSGMQTANARIIDKAIIPTTPIKPKKKVIVILAVILALVFGVLIVFLQDMLNKTIRNVADIEIKLGIPLLGALPLFKTKKKRDKLRKKEALLVFLEENKSNFSEAIRTIRTGIMLSGLDNKEKVVLITSSIPNEGKTTVAINLAMALGQSEKVLLIDGDLRRPSIAKACHIKGEKGLSTLVAGTSNFNESVHTFADWDIDILPSGVIPPNPQELLGSKRFGAMIKALSQKYDRIIIDSAPIQAVSDAQLIAIHANEIVFVVKADSTIAPLVLSGIDKLNKINRPITGVVLNQLDLTKAAKYYSGDYYNGYYHDYGYS